MNQFFLVPTALRSAALLALAAAIQSSAIPTAAAAQLPKTNSPVNVQICHTGAKFQLVVDGEPFYVKGAGCEFGSPEKLAEHGGNSLRTWRTENGRVSCKTVLDRALANGLYVTMGLEIARERHGFDYNDPTAVARQLEAVKTEVVKYKDHPALIIWCIGNELNLNATNAKVWDAVNDISKMIHQVDTNHLTMTALSGIGSGLISELRTRASENPNVF